MAKGRPTLTDELKAAIETADMSMGQIARESGIDIATISRFIHDKGGLSMEGLDAIGTTLGLRIVVDKKKGGRNHGKRLL
jgi:DNA transposition AAA+ family ATPase